MGHNSGTARKRIHTEDAHDIAAFANLVLQRIIPFRERSLLLVEDEARALVHNVRDVPETLNALAW